MENRTNYAELLNKKIISIAGDKAGSDYLQFSFEDGSKYKFYHEQDCCESVSINDLDGDMQDFVGRTLTLAEEYEFDAGKPSEWSESYTWTFYRFQDDTGNMIVVRWLGESNGYYSESVSFREISPATKDLKLSRNPANEGKPRPICPCGTEMTFTRYKGYYEELEYWECENLECEALNEFEPDNENKGAYA